MQTRSQVPNHAAVYVGNSRILQHSQNRLSSIDLYNDWYRKITKHIIRYKD